MSFRNEVSTLLEKMDPYSPPISDQPSPPRDIPKIGLLRSGLIALSAIFVAFRDLPGLHFTGLIMVILFMLISYAAIYFRVAYLLGIFCSLMTLYACKSVFMSLSANADLADNLVQLGVFIPLLFASLIFLGHAYFSGRLYE